MRRTLATALLAGALGGAAASALHAWLAPPPAVAVVDLAAVIRAEAEKANVGRLREHEVEQAAARAADRVRRALARLARERRLVVLPAPAVAAGAPDVTPELMRRLRSEAP